MSAQPESTDTLASPSHSMLHRAHHDVKAYGAVGDGVTDDTTAIQLAITTCHAAGGGTVYFPAGTYKISTLTIGSSGAGQTAAVRLAGASWGTDTVHKGTILLATGAADYGPMLRVHNAHSIAVENMMFYANNLATTCVLLEHDQADTSPASLASEHMRFTSCTFRGGRTYNVQINASGATVTGNVSLVKFDSCMFNHFSGTAHTTAHVYQISANALSNSFDNCQFYGDGTYPTYAVRMEGGGMSFFGCQSVTLGTVDIYMTAVSGQVPPHVYIYGWESQSKRFILYDNSATTANSIWPSVISGVSHSDIENVATDYSISWTQNSATGALGSLVLEGIVAEHNIILNSVELKACLFGVSIVTAAHTVQGTALPYAVGYWRDADGVTDIGLGNSKLSVTATSSGKDQLTITDTTAGAGITIGGDTNLYRGFANRLATDDALFVNNGGTTTQIALVGDGTISFGTAGDTTLYRAAADILATDDSLQFLEHADPAAGAANTARLYCKDNGAGKTQLCVRFNTGAVQVIATEP